MLDKLHTEQVAYRTVGYMSGNCGYGGDYY
jgi:hypothetical protein